MDFWSRLLSPLATGSPRKDQGKDPAKRLHRFEKEYAKLLTSWRTSSNLSRDSEAAETIEIRMQELTNILSDESRRPLPHPCIQYASIKQIYVPIGKIATTSYNEWIIKEAVLLFATLIESEEEAFVENPTFSASLTNLLVRITGVNSVRLGLDTESRVVELAFNITTKIRLDPTTVLSAWFKTPLPSARGEARDRDERDRFAGRTQRVDFPLFYILMDYIHHEGKVGDFARTGLLYIIEAASSSAALEQWIVESDLSTLMATGLGALYSQLSRKLVIDHLPHDLPPILALSDYEHPASNYEIISSCSPEFQSHLETFLSHLLFWQDVLNHCRSVEVKSTLLEHFQVIFLQQLLYPSLLESSDIDGGSSVAVLTYLRRILESLDHPDMINLILHYLLALPDAAAPPNRKPSRSSVSDARKRKSMDLTKMMAEKAEEPATPLLFNLIDLILSCLRSRNQQTIQVTLQLVSAILKRHHRYAVFTLLRTELLPNDATHRTVAAHEQEVEYLVSLAGAIGGKADFDTIYANMLRDTTARVESHPCSLRLMVPRVPTSKLKLPNAPDAMPGAPRDIREHTLRPDDPLLNIILDLLETFFMNAVETNLSVTETMVDLAICGYMNIEGWLSRDPTTYSYVDEDEDEEEEEEDLEEPQPQPQPQPPSPAPAPAPLPRGNSPLTETFDEAQRSKGVQRCRSRPRWVEAQLPRMLQVLKSLSDQIVHYKQTIPRFEELLEQRRDAFQTAESMLDATSPSVPPPAAAAAAAAAAASVRIASASGPGTPERPNMDEALRAASPPRPSALEGFAQRLFSDLATTTTTATPSRLATSPKGRHEHGRRISAGTLTTPGSYPGGGGPGPGGPEVMTPPMAVRGPPMEVPLRHNYNDASPTTTTTTTTTSTTRRGIGRSFSSGSAALAADIGPSPEEQDMVADSQASAFAAFDQSILSRRVGCPPLALDLTRKTEGTGTRPEGEASPRVQVHDQDQDAQDAQDTDGDARSESSLAASTGTRKAQAHGGEEEATVSVSHVLTNTIILQSFLLELASLMQVRAGLFDEVRYV
ncbi:hypothetical protein E4U41_000370 [Claviceps citrina]|nr:hypothetical protein E4U41_000370 [Claviceps citrina]